jgi:hypothetical protein
MFYFGAFKQKNAPSNPFLWIKRRLFAPIASNTYTSKALPALVTFYLKIFIHLAFHLELGDYFHYPHVR